MALRASWNGVLQRLRPKRLAGFALACLLASGSAMPVIAAPTRPADALPTLAVAIAAKLDQSERRATLSFRMSTPLAAQATPLERPDRIVIDLPEVNFQIADQPVPSRNGLIAAFRQGLFAPGRSRIVIDLRRPAQVVSVQSRPVANGMAHDFVIELEAVDRDSFTRAVRAAAPVRESVAEPAPLQARKTKPVIVIDPGHGGVDPGAMAPGGVTEKAIVFAFAQRLRERLVATGRYQVLMTRDSDVFVSLGDRVRLARRAEADLFVSIHADTLSASPKVRGVTVYTGGERASDAESQALADKENRADSIAGVDSIEDVEEVSGILADLTRRETRIFSQQIARQVVADAGSVMRLNKNPHRSAGFRVLTAPDVASILIELGYLSSSEDIALLQSEAWRETSTRAIASAIERFFAERSPIVGRASVSP